MLAPFLESSVRISLRLGFSSGRRPKADTSADRGKTVTKPVPLRGLGLASGEKQIPQVVENLESGGEP
jgi:hypothetical protein